MSSTKSDTAVVSCPTCGARFAVSPSIVGRRARCAACETPFVVPAPTLNPNPLGPTTKSSEIEADIPEYIGLNCRVCETRMYGRSNQIGQQVKCPDCGAMTVVPPPPKPKPKNIPAAMEGEQYELWDTEDQPLPSQILAAQPKYVAIKCTRCGTLMYPTEKQVGQQIACPDCNTKHIVPPPPKPVTRPSVLASDAETPRLDPAARPAERPYVAVPVKKMLHEEQAEEEYVRALEKSKRTGKPMEIDSRGRPIMPRWPLISGVLPFLISTQVPIVALALSLGFLAAGFVMLKGIETAMMGGMAAIGGMCLFASGFATAGITAAAGSSAMLQIIMESSEGNRKIEHWPSLLDWFGSLLYTITSGMMSAFPGWAIGHIPPLNSDPAIASLLAGVSAVICLPIVLLSQLDINSPWGILSRRILASLARCPFTWAFFYLECALIAAICGVPTYFIARSDPGTAIWLTPLYVVAFILFARLLGRLAWRLAEAMPNESQ